MEAVFKSREHHDYLVIRIDLAKLERAAVMAGGLFTMTTFVAMMYGMLFVA